jgi:hypothetical protein
MAAVMAHVAASGTVVLAVYNYVCLCVCMGSCHSLRG